MAGLPKGGYGIVGRMAMRSDKISKEAKAVYALLCSYTGGKHYCYPSVETMAKDLQTSTRTIIRLTEDLKKHGFSRKIKVGKDKRKTAYIPLHPYGGIGDTDDTYLEEIDDTDDMQLGDTDGTVRITDNNNNISMIPKLKQPKTSKKKDKTIPKEIIVSEDMQSVLDTIKKYGKQDLKKSKAARERIGVLLETYTAREICAAYVEFSKDAFWIERDLPLSGFDSQFDRFDVKAQKANRASQTGWHSAQMTDYSPANLKELEEVLAKI